MNDTKMKTANTFKYMCNTEPPTTSLYM